MSPQKFEEWFAQAHLRRSNAWSPTCRERRGARSCRQQIPERQPVARAFAYLKKSSPLRSTAVSCGKHPRSAIARSNLYGARPRYGPPRALVQEPTAQVICDAFHLNDEPVDISPRHVLKRVLELYKAKGWRPSSRRSSNSISSRKIIDPDYPSKRRSAVRAARKPAARPMASMPPMISIRSSRTSTITARCRNSMSTRCRHESGPGPARDQFQSRRSAGTRRPGVPVQAHRAPGGPEARHVCDLHGQAA